MKIFHHFEKLFHWRLLTSWGGTSKETVLMSTHRKWSTHGITKNIPGPCSHQIFLVEIIFREMIWFTFAPPFLSLPSLKITARSYSWTTCKIILNQRLKILWHFLCSDNPLQTSYKKYFYSFEGKWQVLQLYDSGYKRGNLISIFECIYCVLARSDNWQ